MHCVSIGTVFVTTEVRSMAETGTELTNAYSQWQNGYQNNKTFQEMWDILQQKIRCCGYTSFGDFSNMRKQDADENNKTVNQFQCIPRSCLLDMENGNTKNFQDCNKTPENKYRETYLIGCMTIIKKVYKDELYSGKLTFKKMLTFLK